jgi:DNA-binding YbaB/EbfC family protein
MFGKFGDMMGKLQDMKQRVELIKEKLESTVLEVEAAGGDIKIKINGNRKVLSVQIATALQHGNKEELEEQLTVAMNRAIQKADVENESQMKEAASGILPPGMF